MLHPSDQNLHNSAGKTIKLSSGLRSEPIGRTLKQTIINHRQPISVIKNNDIGQNRSMQLDRKQANHEHAAQKWDKMIATQKDVNSNWNKEIQNQRQSLMTASREIKRISTELDDSIHRSNEKSMHFSQNNMDYRTPMLRKDQSQFTRASHNIQNDVINSNERSGYQLQIQDLMNKIQFVQNQCRNLRTQNQHLHRSLGTPKEILQREIENKNFRIDDLEKRFGAKNSQYLDKCIENQKNIAKVTELQQILKKLQAQKQRLSRQLQRANQFGADLVKTLNEAKSNITRIEAQKKKHFTDWQAEKLKNIHLSQQKKLLQLELQKIRKIKQLVKELEQSDHDKAEVIKKHIAYQAQLIDLNGVMISNLQTHKHDLKVTAEQHQSINKQIESITQQIAIKVKDVLDQKQRVEDELAEAKAETQRIRKTMFTGYQDIISKLKDQIIQLKEENVNLSNNSQSKITIVKLQRQITILETKNQDLLSRHKEMQEIIQRLNNENKKTASQLSSQTSIRVNQYYDRAGKTDIESIILTYQSRNHDLNQRIRQKQISQIQLKHRVEQLQNEIQQMKDQAQLSNRKQKCDNDNVKAKIESMKMELKAETDSLNRKIQALQKNIQRKNKQIKQKDNFITHYLIQKVKGQSEVSQIVQEIDKFFVESQVQA